MVWHELEKVKFKLSNDRMKVRLDHRPAGGNYKEADDVWFCINQESKDRNDPAKDHTEECKI